MICPHCGGAITNVIEITNASFFSNVNATAIATAYIPPWNSNTLTASFPTAVSAPFIQTSADAANDPHPTIISTDL